MDRQLVMIREAADEDRRVIAASREYSRQDPEGGVSFEQVVADCGFAMDQVRQAAWQTQTAALVETEADLRGHSGAD